MHGPAKAMTARSDQKDVLCDGMGHAPRRMDRGKNLRLGQSTTGYSKDQCPTGKGPDFQQD